LEDPLDGDDAETDKTGSKIDKDDVIGFLLDMERTIEDFYHDVLKDPENEGRDEEFESRISDEKEIVNKIILMILWYC
jgi:hypothetical protein